MAHDPTIVAVADRIYRALLRLYPAPFRAQHGGEMALDFADASHDAHVSQGWRGLLTHWSHALADLAITIVQQWCRTFWPIVGVLSMAFTVIGWSAALRLFRTGPYDLFVDPQQQEMALLLVLLLGALIPIFGVVVFCGCFLRPHLDRVRRRRRV